MIGRRVLAEGFGGEKSFGIYRKKRMICFSFSRSLLETFTHSLKKSAHRKMSSDVDLKVKTYSIAPCEMFSASKYFNEVALFTNFIALRNYNSYVILTTSTSRSLKCSDNSF